MKRKEKKDGKKKHGWSRTSISAQRKKMKIKPVPLKRKDGADGASTGNSPKGGKPGKKEKVEAPTQAELDGYLDKVVTAPVSFEASIDMWEIAKAMKALVARSTLYYKVVAPKFIYRISKFKDRNPDSK